MELLWNECGQFTWTPVEFVGLGYVALAESNALTDFGTRLRIGIGSRENRIQVGSLMEFSC